jgi:hypothetical protein
MGHEKMGFGFGVETVRTILEKQDASLSEYLWFLEMDYVDRAIDYIGKNFSTRLSIEEQSEGWSIDFFLLKDDAAFYTTNFHLTKKTLFDEMREVEMEVPVNQ